jgi:hypothetical protein
VALKPWESEHFVEQWEKSHEFTNEFVEKLVDPKEPEKPKSSK